ncbi:MAG TPA: tetrahydrofolate dehydrogenase/cyclohydrolase catalytic domain-containing protein, partial [Gemmatimonadales bacterium]|nr:tetrahydrofolate dehydrogenase/cyclohydrolase catalytic domain-containing protein [Gemmatimonadales bacterium]
MTARLLDGAALGRQIRGEVAADVAHLAGEGIRPGLAVILVGEDPASQVYVRSKGKACEEAGMKSVTHRLPASTTQDDLLALIDQVN